MRSGTGGASPTTVFRMNYIAQRSDRRPVLGLRACTIELGVEDSQGGPATSRAAIMPITRRVRFHIKGRKGSAMLASSRIITPESREPPANLLARKQPASGAG